MKKFVLAVLVALPLVFSPGLTFAKDYGNHHFQSGKYKDKHKSWGNHRGKGKWHGKHKATAVPEIDAASAALAIALMGGVVSIAREKRRRQKLIES